jgi:hypothetical protein
MMISLTRRVQVEPGILTRRSSSMAWRPYSNLIDGELDNRIPGKVTGWIRFFRSGKRPLKAVFDLDGDFHEDIRGKVIRLQNPEPSDRDGDLDGEGTYMEGFSHVQRGQVGNITAGLPLGVWTDDLSQKLMAQNELIWDEVGLQGPERERRRQLFADNHREHIAAGDLYYPYTAYPYIEWYSEANGRVVLELEPSQLEILDGVAAPEKRPQELVADKKRREQAMVAFLAKMLEEASRENRKKGGDGNVFGLLAR